MKRTLFSLIIFFFCLNISFGQAPPWQWVKAAFSPGNELANDVAYDSINDVVYTAGSFDGDLSAIYGPVLGVSLGLKDGLLAKYTSTGGVVWAIKLGGLLDDEIRSVAVDNNGDVYVSGTFNGIADFDPSLGVYNLVATGILGQPDGFLAKYSSGGNLIWAVKFGGINSETVDHIFADASYVYLTGSYNGSAIFYSTSATTKTTTALQSGSNFYGAKYNSNGVIQWVVTGGATGNEEGYDVVADANKVYFTGQYENNFTLYNALGTAATVLPVMAANKSDAFIIAYNQSGTFAWATNVASVESDTGNGITGDANNLYVTGSIKDFANFPNPSPVFTQTNSGGPDIYLASLSKSTGTFLWVSQQTGSSASDQMPLEITLFNGNTIVSAGYFNGNLNYAPYGGPNYNSFGAEDVFLSAHNLSGNYLWSKQAGANAIDIPYGLSPGPDGVYLSGEYAGAAAFGGILLANDAGKNLFVGKTGCLNISNNNVSSSQTICPGNLPQMMSGSTPSGGVTPYTYYWEQSPDNVNWFAAAGTNSLQNYSAPTLTTDTWYRRLSMALQTCTSSVSNTVLVTMDVLPSAAIAGSDQSLCAVAASLNAVNPQNGNGNWSVIFGGATVISPSNPNSGVTNVTPGTNQFVWTVSGGSLCPSKSDTVVIMRDVNPTTANAGTNQSVCGSSATLSGNTPVSGNAVWTIYSGNASITNPGSPVSAVSNLNEGNNIFIWTISSGVCAPSTASVVIRAYPPVTNVSAGTDVFICSDQLKLNASADTSGQWSVVSGSAMFSDSASANSSLTNIAAGDNVFRWTVENGPCPVVFDEVLVHRDVTPPVAFAGPDQEIEKPETFLSASQPSVGTASWTLKEGTALIENVNDPKSRVTQLLQGDNIFVWTVKNGVCPESSDEVLIRMKELNIPNAFSPNDDGYNDAFTIPYIEYYENVHLSVFNRWGGEVFYSSDYKNNWKGTNQSNEKLSDDTYYYTLEIGSKTRLSGFVILKQNK